MSKLVFGGKAVPPRYRMVGLLVIALAVAVAVGGVTSRSAQAVLDPTLPNTVQQWNKVAEDTVVTSGAFQGEGENYMAYASAAVYDAVVAIQGGFEPLSACNKCSRRRLVDAAVVQAAYQTLSTYFPSSCNTANAACMALGASLLSDYTAAMGAIPGGSAKTNGMSVGAAAAAGIVALRRIGDGARRLSRQHPRSRRRIRDPESGGELRLMRRRRPHGMAPSSRSSKEPGPVQDRAAPAAHESDMGTGIRRGQGVGEVRQRRPQQAASGRIGREYALVCFQDASPDEARALDLATLLEVSEKSP